MNRQTHMRDVSVTVADADLEEILSLTELSIFGLGNGASRLTELYDLTTPMTTFHDGKVHFHALSNKIGKIQAKRARANERVLPRSLSRCYLLARLIINCVHGTPCENKIIPLMTNRSYVMTSLVAEIFSLNAPLKVLQVRHLFTSILNVLFPKALEVIVSDNVTSTRSGHSAITAAKHYGTRVARSPDEKTHLFHELLGERTHTSVSGRLEAQTIIPITDEEQGGIIRAMFGEDAVFRNRAQEDLMKAICSPRKHHVAACLPCGMGKSICAVSAVVDGSMRGTKRKSTIMIVPYTTLGAHQHITLQRLLDNVIPGHFQVGFYSARHVSQRTIPEDFNLDSHSHLPDVVILTIDAFDNLLRFHCQITSHWISNSLIERIVLDEIHLALTELNFRESYQCLKKVHTFRVQVVILSATVNSVMAMDIAAHLGLINNYDDRHFQIIEAGPAVPNDRFSLSVSDGNVEDIANLIVKVTNDEAHTQILCSTIKMAESIGAILKQMNTKGDTSLVFRVVTGKDSSDTKTAAGEDWQDSRIQVLISTTCLVLGVENNLLKSGIVAGLPANLSTLVQFLGRFRIDNRSEESSVVQFIVPFTSKAYHKEGEQGSDNIDRMYDSGILLNTPKETANSYFGHQAVDKFYKKDGCIVANLNIAMGHYGTLDCSRCSNCLKKGHNKLTLSRTSHQSHTQAEMGSHHNPVDVHLDVCPSEQQGSFAYPNVFYVLNQKNTTSV